MLGKYSDGLSEMLAPYKVMEINFGIGFASSSSNNRKGLQNLHEIDFLVTVNEDGSINILADRGFAFSKKKSENTNLN